MDGPAPSPWDPSLTLEQGQSTSSLRLREEGDYGQSYPMDLYARLDMYFNRRLCCVGLPM